MQVWSHFVIYIK